jgi:hypothetical protein
MKVISVIQFSLQIPMYSRFERPLMLEVGHMSFSAVILGPKLIVPALTSGEVK